MTNARRGSKKMKTEQEKRKEKRRQICRTRENQAFTRVKSSKPEREAKRRALNATLGLEMYLWGQTTGFKNVLQIYLVFLSVYLVSVSFISTCYDVLSALTAFGFCHCVNMLPVSFGPVCHLF